MQCELFRSLVMSGAEDAQAWAGHLHECGDCSDWYMALMIDRRGFDASDFPCVHMGYYSTMECAEHPYPSDCPDRVIVYSPVFDEYGIRIGRGHADSGPEGDEGSAGAYTIQHCPWCGRKLPASKLREWIETLARLGFDDPFEQEIPDRFRSDRWWREPEEG